MPNKFIFFLCQPGFEKLLKKEMETCFPEFKFSFSTAGFLTYKCPEDFSKDDIPMPIFASECGLSLGMNKERQPLLDQLNGIEHSLIEFSNSKLPNEAITPEFKNDTFLLIELRPNSYFLGELLTRNKYLFNDPKAVLPEEAPSRAYLKLAEPYLLFDLPFVGTDRVLEVGSAPGGGTFFMLNLGMRVLSVDPAKMVEAVTDHKRHKHIRVPIQKLKWENLPELDWIISDINLDFDFILGILEKGLKTRFPNKGLVLTMKLMSIPDFDRVYHELGCLEDLGFEIQAVMQLPSNKQECCVYAVRKAI